jgi:thiol-disulfide isomerase/thioredoxin
MILFLTGIVRAVGSTTQSSLNLDDATLDRGERVLQVVRDTVAEAQAAKAVWPERLAEIGAKGLGLTYVKPRDIDPDKEAWEFSPTVILYESLKEHPSGVWVGFADGHMEFARDEGELKADLREIEIARRMEAVRERPAPNAATKPSTEPATEPTGELTLKIVGPDGEAVRGAMVGMFGSFGDAFPGQPRTWLYLQNSPRQETVVLFSNRQGLVTLKATDVSGFYGYKRHGSVPLYIMDEREGLGALESVAASEFGGTSAGAAGAHEVRLHPLCRVDGRISSLGLRSFGLGVTCTICYPLFEAGFFQENTIESDNNGPYFDVLLPSGEYDFWVYGTDSIMVHHYARIAEGRKELNLQIDLEPFAAVTKLPRKMAPELKDVVAWKNPGTNRGASKLADLRGKIVLLDFWGYWCGYCVGDMPELMSIYDEFHGKGLEVVTVHDNTVASVADLEGRLAEIRRKEWNGRDLPFPVAIDGGRRGAPGSGSRGENVTAYGVTGFPTTFVIDRNGEIVESLNLENPGVRAEVARLVGEGANKPK